MSGIKSRSPELARRRTLSTMTPAAKRLSTFGDRDRGAGEGGRRTLSIGYLALLSEVAAASLRGAGWHDWYRYFPWEDWRRGRPVVLDRLERELRRWARTAPTQAGRATR